MADNPMPDIGLPVQILPADQFAQSGVYFLISGGEVVYVGQSSNMRKRIGQHLSDGSKEFDAVSCIPCAVGMLLRREAYYIGKLAPKYNQCSVSKQVKNMVEAGWDNLVVDLGSSGNNRLDTDRAAAFLGISRERLERLQAQGVAPTLKRFGRKRVRGYEKYDLQVFAERHKDLLAT